RTVEGGVVVQLEPRRPTDPQLLKVEVLADNIIHVVAAPGDSFSARPSLVVQRTDWPAVKWTQRRVGDDVLISTDQLGVRVNRTTGRVSFFDADGDPILQEKAGGGAILTPDTVLGEPVYRARQLFDSPADEAFYGLGQHQNGVMNYKGHAVDLRQYNIVVAVPFLVSSRHYGILWDNDSHTEFGDPREYQPLSKFELLDGQGKPGGLTVQYFKDADFQAPLLTQREPAIEHEYTDEPGVYPQGFDRNRGSIRWSGSIVPGETGTYKLQLYASSYVKMWVNGKKVVDSWRQNWLPWTHLIDVPAKAGQPVPIRVEWIPSGGFIGLNALTPAPASAATTLSLASDVADQIDYYFIYGKKMDDVIGGYRELTGRAPMMPKWAMGLWQSRERYRTQEEVLSTVREFRERHIPLDDIVQDWFYWPEDQWGSHDFDPARFPDPVAMVDTLHGQLHAHVMITVWPKYYVGTKNYRTMADSGWLYMHKIQRREKDWVGPGYVSTFYDAFNPAARKNYWGQIDRKLFSKGFDAWWLDSSEPDMGDVMTIHQRILRMNPTALGSGARYENAYSLMHTQGVYQGQRRSAPNQRVFILTRSSFAGQQRNAAATWSGDVAARWEDLANQIPAGLNFSLSGIPYWTTDIGGFAVEPRYEHPDSANLAEWRELMTRWFQFGAFSPLFRVHGQFPYREMYNVAPPEHPAYRSMLSYDRLRYRLMPYIYSLTGMVTQRGYTIMRALVMDFGGDPKVRDIGDEYMFGPAILVSPVTKYRARSRPVYLPAGGGWYDFHTGRYYAGGQTIQADAPYTDLPLFVRAGSIVPFGPAIEWAAQKPADPVRLHVYTGRDGAFTLYEDQDTTYDYEHGAFSEIPMRYDEATRTLTIGARRGSFPGMLKSRTFEVVWVGSDRPVGYDMGRAPDRTVRYDGAAVTVRR
ncbi:MAG TPA: TIM-barrel domain-containing protein, partial [Longimicrobiaceae bacterium]|nr:TIM-barrel domain-containing protein [Longimicrobiaceae bacterium]